MAISAILNIGKLTGIISIKSITKPSLNLSMKFPIAPPNINPMADPLNDLKGAFIYI